MVALQAPIEIGLLIYPEVQLSAVYGLTDLFGFADRIACERFGRTEPFFRITHFETGRDFRDVARGFESMPGGDDVPNAIIIPPCLHLPEPSYDLGGLVAWLERCHASGTTLASVCAGAFLLAETGLLNGRQATTHWTCATDLADRFPTINVDANKVLIDYGDIITAGGMMAWADLGLKLVERLIGRTSMMATAKFLLVDPPGREQRYYSTFSPRMNHGDTAVLKSQQRLLAENARVLTTADMATWAGLEVRTFLRRFQKATGMTPNEYWQHLRIEKARDLLEETTVSLQNVAWKAGYEDPGSFRKVFIRITGLTPTEYRKRFGPG